MPAQPIKTATRTPHHHLMPSWLIHLGAIGVFAVAMLDASPIPLPLPGSTDVLILLLAAHRGNPWGLTGAAVAGSLCGAYITWGVAKKGGMALVERYVPDRWLRKLRPRMERHGALGVALACVMPPPIPLMPFLLLAGALGVEKRPYLTAVGVARVVRYGAMAWLGATYGRRVVRAWERYLSGWSDVILWTFFSLLIAAVIFGVWKYRHDRRRVMEKPAAQAAG
ncbi:YqaA family protein [Silvibacterium sp.]|uniref:YqaA family protein n=1 Tax=Silvibacterium sp. TaxID=1964179 RepID=UPI0039E42978